MRDRQHAGLRASHWHPRSMSRVGGAGTAAPFLCWPRRTVRNNSRRSRSSRSPPGCPRTAPTRWSGRPPVAYALAASGGSAAGRVPAGAGVGSCGPGTGSTVGVDRVKCGNVRRCERVEHLGAPHPLLGDQEPHGRDDPLVRLRGGVTGTASPSSSSWARIASKSAASRPRRRAASASVAVAASRRNCRQSVLPNRVR